MGDRLLLIRHGETDWTAEKRYCGRADIELNARGAEQARELARKLRRVKVDKIYSSDLKRAFDFARRVFKGRRIQKLAALREMNFGVFEGMRYEEVQDSYPRLYRRWLNDPFHTSIPGGERLADMTERLKKTVKKVLCRGSNQTNAVVTHGGVIKVMLCGLMGFEVKKELWRIEPPPSCAWLIDIEKDRTETRTLEGEVIQWGN